MGASVASRLAAFAAISSVLSSGAFLASTAACDDDGTGGQGTGGAGTGGTGGAPGCPDDVAPLFTLHVLARKGALPADLRLDVSWSAGDEPAVELGDDSTYGTSADNVICVRNVVGGPTGASTGTGSGDGGGGGGAVTTGGEGGGRPDDELLCELWTSGPTRIRLDATGYVAVDETLAPATTDGCDRPVPSEVEIEVVADEPEEADATE